MRNLYIGFLVGMVFLLAACSKTLKVDSVAFDATTSSNTYNAGDTVHFQFEGQPDMITFYSGEPGHNYDFRERTIAEGNPQMQFNSYEQWGTQKNTLHLLISKDFDGVYDEANITKANWVDLTDDATLSTGDNGTPSGIIDLSKYVTSGEPFYFAFHFIGSTGTTQRTWTITDFQIDLLLDDGTSSSVANMMTAGWHAISFKNDQAVWTFSSSQLQIKGGNAASDDNDDWIITAPLNPNKVSPDRGVAIKEITETLSGYDYVYTTPGSYKAEFVAVNASADGEKHVMKTVDLTIK